MARTKIICTIGPASDPPAILKKIMSADMAVARINFSHGDHASHQRRTDLIRRLDRNSARPVKILQDLEGFRVRVGRFKDGRPINLNKGQTLNLTNRNVQGEGNLVPFDYDGSLEEFKRGNLIYIDDGTIVLSVRSHSKYVLKTEVLIPGLLKEKKGVNIPDIDLKITGLKPKDKRDIDFGVRNRVDFIAQSFVRNRNDVMQVRRHLGKRLPDCAIIAKIENQSGIENIDEIL